LDWTALAPIGRADDKKPIRSKRTLLDCTAKHTLATRARLESPERFESIMVMLVRLPIKQREGGQDEEEESP
jgi:hypothetical protein